MEQLKPFLTHKEQVERLRAHGCQIEDSAEAQSILSQINYYRFSAYFLPFRQKDGAYGSQISFNTAYRIYEFDRKLRSILFTAVARIEVFLRSQIAYCHAEHYGLLGYLDSASFRPHGHDHQRFCKQIDEAISKNAKVLFVQHYIQKYNRQFPLWVLTELFTFGMLSRFYADMRANDQKTVARKVGAQYPKQLMSWLRCCTEFRNICAHHGRLYYRSFSSSPAGFDTLNDKSKRSVFAILLVLKTLYPNKSEWNREVFNAVNDLLDEYQPDVHLRHIGFPQDWKNLLAEK
jgi:abortive infection bacteriophage resistance protein